MCTTRTCTRKHVARRGRRGKRRGDKAPPERTPVNQVPFTAKPRRFTNGSDYAVQIYGVARTIRCGLQRLGGLRVLVRLRTHAQAAKRKTLGNINLYARECAAILERLRALTM